MFDLTNSCACIMFYVMFKLIMNSCKEDYDSWVQGAILAKVGCRPPYWDVRSDYPNCTTQQQLKLFGKMYSSWLKWGAGLPTGI